MIDEQKNMKKSTFRGEQSHFIDVNARYAINNINDHIKEKYLMIHEKLISILRMLLNQ